MITSLFMCDARAFVVTCLHRRASPDSHPASGRYF
jgi:hypothetical protein